MLKINMLGKVNIIYNNVCISDNLSSKLVALICLLVLNKNRNMSKEKIICYLWPDSNDEAAKSNLRFNLWNIKKIIPPNCDGQDFIISGKDYCKINENYDFYCDKTALDGFKTSSEVSIEDLISLKELFKGDFLEGLYLRNCNEFNEMILFERVVCQNKQVEILEKLTCLYDELGKYEEGLQVLNEVSAIEPYNEQFACQTIELYGKLGNRTAAINYYKNFESVLRRNLNTAPNNELKLLYGEMMESSTGIKMEQKSKARTQKKRIVIHPCCLKDVEYFGMVSIIDEIMKVTEKKYLFELDKAYIMDLGYVHVGLKLDYEKMTAGLPENVEMVPPVRIVNAFIKLILHVSDYYDIQIQIADLGEMDPISKNLIRHIESMKLTNVSFEF